jgi:hypothetical protein
MAHGDLTAITGKDIETVYANNSDADDDRYGQQGIREKEREGKKNDKEGCQYSPLGFSSENSHVLCVVLLKDPAG